MIEPRGEVLITRYKQNYRIATEFPITEEMILSHWDLEQRLTKRLLESNTQDRWQVFEECYSALYSELDWLNEAISEDESLKTLYSDWQCFIGPPPKRVYEVGSGKGSLIGYLAGAGYVCKGSEITRERGQKWAVSHPNLEWGVTDGIHLDTFEPSNSYDAVISDQVIEHLHPDDLVNHFQGARAILKPAGKYALSTPHRVYGPMDVSRVFGYDAPRGMHLKEYTFREVVKAARQAGFSKFAAPVRVPRKFRRLFGDQPHPWNSRSYLAYLMWFESALDLLPTQASRRRAARVARIVMFDGVILVAQT